MKKALLLGIVMIAWVVLVVFVWRWMPWQFRGDIEDLRERVEEVEDCHWGRE